MEGINRDEMELLLRGGTDKDKKTGQIIKESNYLVDWKLIPKAKRSKINNLWGGKDFNLAKLRNDVLHSGFRKNAKSANEIINQTKEIVQELKLIAQVWELEDK
jgi:hypothetical protein